MHHQAQEAWLEGLMGRIHDMFIIAHCVEYCNYKDMVWVLYLDLDPSCLPPFKMDVITFFLEIHVRNLNPYQFLEEFVIPCHASREALTLVIEPLEDSRAEEG